MKNFKLSAVLLLGSFILAGCMHNTPQTPEEEITNFDECAAAGYPVMESFPEQCRTPDGKVFVRNVGNVMEKMDEIRLENPRPNDLISSPLVVEGEAVGPWFFEATFPVVLTDWDGRIIAESFATAEGDWMTEDFVPFTATLEFETPTPGDPARNRGSLILQKANPSGLPENADALEFPVEFE